MTVLIVSSISHSIRPDGCLLSTDNDPEALAIVTMADRVRFIAKWVRARLDECIGKALRAPGFPAKMDC